MIFFLQEHHYQRSSNIDSLAKKKVKRRASHTLVGARDDVLLVVAACPCVARSGRGGVGTVSCVAFYSQYTAVQYCSVALLFHA